MEHCESLLIWFEVEIVNMVLIPKKNQNASLHMNTNQKFNAHEKRPRCQVQVELQFYDEFSSYYFVITERSFSVSGHWSQFEWKYWRKVEF